MGIFRNRPEILVDQRLAAGNGKSAQIVCDHLIDQSKALFKRHFIGQGFSCILIAVLAGQIAGVRKVPHD